MRIILGLARRLGQRLRQQWLEATLVVGFIGLLAWFGFAAAPYVRPLVAPLLSRGGQFDGEAAYRHVLAQTEIGPRPTGSAANQQAAAYFITQLKQFGWTVETQEFTYQNVAARNIIARTGSGPVAIIGAHYDTRRRADNDPDPARRDQPVLGGNDGASGAAVLLELARSLDKSKLTHEVWLTFFDAEDNGRLDGWEFIAGSSYMANALSVKPEMVIVVDMIGDADQQIYQERNSTPELVNRIWTIAAALGYGDWFLPSAKWAMTDDHSPFLRQGIPAADLIDFDYPYWHTTQDTADKVAPASLERVGRVLEVLLESAGATTP